MKVYEIYWILPPSLFLSSCSSLLFPSTLFSHLSLSPSPSSYPLRLLRILSSLVLPPSHCLTLSTPALHSSPFPLDAFGHILTPEF